MIEQTMEKLTGLRLHGMVTALERWKAGGGPRDIAPEDLVGVLAQSEWTERENRRLTSRLRQARFREAATVEAIDYQHRRGLKKGQIMDLVSGEWIGTHHNVILTGSTGVGKTFLACAVGDQACRTGYKVHYARSSRFFGSLKKARADGTYPKVMQKLQKTPLLILDDFGSAPLDGHERNDLREVMEDRYGQSSTLITSQMEPNHWHTFIGDETLADSILDRLVHNAHRIKLAGESIRKTKGMKA